MVSSLSRVALPLSQIDSNPDGQDLERIAALTGLSKRVTQVWFQNSRARQKKYMNKARGGANGGSSSSNGSGGSPWVPQTTDHSLTTLGQSWSTMSVHGDTASHCSEEPSSPIGALQ